MNRLALKHFLVTALAFFSVLVGETVKAYSQVDTTGANIFEIERKTLIDRIAFEKSRIKNEFKSADVHFFAVTDSVTAFILSQDVSKEKRNLYLHRLHLFLQNVKRYYSDSYLKNGTYLALLCYYPIMIDWDRQDELLRNLKRYANFSIKAARLIPSDTIAEDFLTDYMKDYPDDVFRYAEEFDDRAFAGRLMDKALRKAPESGKRYLSTNNSVSNTLLLSNDVYVRKAVEVYNRFGMKSHAFLLLDDIVNKKVSLEEAEAIANLPDKMFSTLVLNSTKYETAINYSAYRYVDNYCIEAVRKLSSDVQTPNYQFDSFKRRSLEEMFMLIVCGYREATPKTVQALLDITKRKADGIPVNSILILSMGKEKLKKLVFYCDEHQMLDQLLGLVDDERRDYLLELTTLDDHEDLMPPFKSFGHERPTAFEMEYRTMTESTKARPPKSVITDITPRPTQKPVVTKKAKPGDPFVLEAPLQLNTDIVPRAEILPMPAAKPMEPIKIGLEEKPKKILALKKNLLNTIQQIPSFIEKDYAEEVLMYAAQKEPDEMFKKVDSYKRKFYSKKVLEQCAINAPLSFKRYLYNRMHPANYILQYSTDPIVKKIIAINPQLGYHSKPLLLLDDIMAGKMTVEEAIKISQQPEQLFSAVVKIISRPTYIGKYSINHEMRDYSLRFVREINDNIASGSQLPFYTVENLNAQELYFLMIFGRDEVFTSTFNGLFNRFMQKIPSGDGQAFLKSINHNRFRDFVSLCASYGVLEEFLAKFKPGEQHDLLTAYISKLETERDNLSSIVMVAEALSNVADVKLQRSMQGMVRKEFERVTEANDKIGIAIYGVLSSIISGTAKVDETWYRRISQQFQVTPVNTLPAATLFTRDSLCIERMYFYNDDDGRSSYINFVNTYKGQSQWNIEETNNYIRIYSYNGKKIEIFANKPEYDENGIAAIDSALQKRNLSPTVIVHRGHSFHTESTLERVPGSARLVFVGSCGGFYKISIALENAPDAHIISTKQVGTKTVNDAMIYALNENIRQGNDIIWNEFWDKMREKLASNQYFRDYIPPNKNLEATFIKAYYKILGV